jgi:hypothetical protein
MCTQSHEVLDGLYERTLKSLYCIMYYFRLPLALLVSLFFARFRMPGVNYLDRIKVEL